MVMTDSTDFSLSYDIVLKYAKTPSWCIRIIAAGFPLPDRVSKEDGYGEEDSEAAILHF